MAVISYQLNSRHRIRPQALGPVSRPRAFHIGRKPLSERGAAADIGKADLAGTASCPALNDHAPGRDVDDASAAEAEITRLVLCPSGVTATARRPTPTGRRRGRPAPIPVRFKTGRRASVVTIVILRRRDARRGGNGAKGKQNADGRFREVDHQSNSRLGHTPAEGRAHRGKLMAKSIAATRRDNSLCKYNGLMFLSCFGATARRSVGHCRWPA